MTGPQHYAEAEEHLAWAASIETDGHDDGMSAWHQRQAQVHATLAAAAATAIGSPDLPSGDWDDWRFVASAGHAGRIPGSERPVTP